MRREFFAAIAAATFWTAAQGLCAQSTTSPKSPPAAPKPAQSAPTPAGQNDTNPFPEDTNSVPILSNNPSVLAEPSADEAAGARVHLPGSDLDPVPSPDDPVLASGSSSGFSDSATGLDQLLEPPPNEGKSRKNPKTPAPTPETAAQDISVGNYYLSTHDWRGALSRFESALVLSPDDPAVYWGLAECQRHLGQFAEARTNYTKVVEYDPDSKRSKEAKKHLHEPEIANARAGAPAAQ